ncbi:hypothetical protein J2I47_03310 [Fibrella sp. HMF5335]|uniref:Uncharacterized protein n=1 Tax=Fibrella rubiginis TaxID=2817060 RepID=A0A939GB08_9BACT|nr:hypothetical protein [Fibrella rubiginis]MBO0935569.1 hypothetical protein [Fibrella rubiginis]
MRITDKITYQPVKREKPLAVSLVNLAFTNKQTERYTTQVLPFIDQDEIAIQYSLSPAQPAAATYLVRYQLTVN